MNLEEKYIEKLSNIYELNEADIEAIHVDADNLLLEFLVDAGYKRLARAWNELRDDTGFWYA